jgi:hypothetical protein
MTVTVQQFVDAVASMSFADTFNPYAHCCQIYDRSDAPLRRRQALFSMLEVASESEVDAIWIGRDLGYRGGRRTGLALTDDIHMEAHAARWGVLVSRPTTGQLVAERTAAVVWSVLSQISARVFLWNVFPLHPHETGMPFTNRAHNACERRAGEELLALLLELLHPYRLIAIGNDAASSAYRVCHHTSVVQVRHPSYGGHKEFLRKMKDLYSLPEPSVEQRLFS